MSRSPTGIVLTGGRSARMGTDKAVLVVEGRPLAVRVADALWEGGCSPVECQGGPIDQLEAFGLGAVPDITPHGGPVSAIAQALARTEGPIVAAACDLPHLDGETVRTVLSAGVDSAGVAHAVADGRAHLVSYWPATAGPTLERVLADGPASYRDALAATGSVAVPVSASAVTNLNRPGDLDGS